MASESGLRELNRFVREIGKMPKDLAKQARPMMRRSGQEALAEAKSNASWSTRIPGATKLSVRFSKRFSGIAIVTNKNRAPHARPIENAGKTGTFRHRNFGRNDWSVQRAQPFQAPVAKKWFLKIDREIGKVVDDVIRPYGFKG